MTRLVRLVPERARRFARLPLVVPALLAVLGCSALDNCPDSESARLVTDGVTNIDRLTYESKPWDGELDHFPAKSTLWFEHGLGVTPLNITPYLSFRKEGTNDSDHGSVTTSAGNQSLIDCVDSRFIVLRNDTCEPSFYVRLTADGEGRDLGDECGPPP